MRDCGSGAWVFSRSKLLYQEMVERFVERNTICYVKPISWIEQMAVQVSLIGNNLSKVGHINNIKTNRRYLHENRKPSMQTPRTAYLRLNIEKSVNGNPTAPV